MTTIRCSSLDAGMICSSRFAEAKNPYNPETDEAREGTAGHAALAKWVGGEEVALGAIAADHRVSRDELAMIFNRGVTAWEDLRQWFPEARSEVQMQAELDGDVMLTGTTDVLSELEAIAVLDWKAGWRPSDHPHQLRGYAYLAARKAEGLGRTVDEVLAVEVHLRVGEFEIHRWGRGDLETWALELVNQTRRIGAQWGPGPVSCQYCPHQLSCQAREDYIHGAAAALKPVAGPGGSLTPTEIAGLWDKSRELKRALSRYESVVKELLREGPIQISDDRELRLIETTRDKIIPSRAMPLLREELALTPAEADQVLRVSKSKLRDVVKARCEKGRGAAAIRATLAALDDARAIEKTTHQETRAVRRASKGARSR